jgi:hypothetical protein
LDVGSEAVYLPLKKGDNELLLAVTEFFGGWGFLCKLEPVGRLSLESSQALALVGATREVVTYRGRRAVRLSSLPAREGSDEGLLAILNGLDFRDGTIEVEVAGSPRPGVSPDMRGFIGIAFRLQPDGSRFEQLFLRPTNGRAEDQLRRNHSVQYASIPDFPWYRLRQESPGMYESYVDLEAGAWTKVKIAVSGTTARLYVNGANQPCLVVKDLKLGEVGGTIALWAHSTTDAYFSDLLVSPAN